MTGKVLLSRPKDRSIEAFNAWFQEFVKHLTGRDELDGTVTDESLRQLWEKSWAARSSSSVFPSWTLCPSRSLSRWIDWRSRVETLLRVAPSLAPRSEA